MSDLNVPPQPRVSRMLHRRVRLGGLATLVFTAGLSADHLTKVWALNSLADGLVVPLLPTISFRLAFNPGIAFGLGADAGPSVAFAILLILLALSLWILWTLIRGEAHSRALLLTAVAAGGWGNMVDRITRAEGIPLSGTVIDFIAVDWFAIFNFGDVLAVCGMVAWATVTALSRPRHDSLES